MSHIMSCTITMCLSSILLIRCQEFIIVISILEWLFFKTRILTEGLPECWGSIIESRCMRIKLNRLSMRLKCRSMRIKCRCMIIIEIRCIFMNCMRMIMEFMFMSSIRAQVIIISNHNTWYQVVSISHFLWFTSSRAKELDFCHRWFLGWR